MCQSIMKKTEKEKNSQSYIIKKIIKNIYDKISYCKVFKKYCWSQKKVTKKVKKYEKLLIKEK